MTMILEEHITDKIIGAAIEVHKYWGPGLLENIYKQSLIHELKTRSVVVQQEVPFSLNYKGINVGEHMRIDLLVEDKVIVELKAVNELIPIHDAQLLSYMRIARCRIGLLINFNALTIKSGFKRFVL